MRNTERSAHNNTHAGAHIRTNTNFGTGVFVLCVSIRKHALIHIVSMPVYIFLIVISRVPPTFRLLSISTCLSTSGGGKNDIIICMRACLNTSTERPTHKSHIMR